MNIDGCLARNNNFTGWWNVTNPQHPEYQTHDASTSAGVEILTGALHHITTLQGMNPLSVEDGVRNIMHSKNPKSKSSQSRP